MNCFADIKRLAEEKIVDAECLNVNGRLDGAYYMAGYAIELYLKARICKNLGIDDFYADTTTRQKPKGQGDINKAFKVNDLDQLLLLSGIFTEFENSNDRMLK